MLWKYRGGTVPWVWERQGRPPDGEMAWAGLRAPMRFAKAEGRRKCLSDGGETRTGACRLPGVLASLGSALSRSVIL